MNHFQFCIQKSSTASPIPISLSAKEIAHRHTDPETCVESVNCFPGNHLHEWERSLDSYILHNRSKEKQKKTLWRRLTLIFKSQIKPSSLQNLGKDRNWWLSSHLNSINSITQNLQLPTALFIRHLLTLFLEQSILETLR